MTSIILYILALSCFAIATKNYIQAQKIKQQRVILLSKKSKGFFKKQTISIYIDKLTNKLLYELTTGLNTHIFNPNELDSINILMDDTIVLNDSDGSKGTISNLSHDDSNELFNKMNYHLQLLNKLDTIQKWTQTVHSKINHNSKLNNKWLSNETLVMYCKVKTDG